MVLARTFYGIMLANVKANVYQVDLEILATNGCKALIKRKWNIILEIILDKSYRWAYILDYGYYFENNIAKINCKKV